MNATWLVMSSALAIGGDVTPAGHTQQPVTVIQGAGCSNCGPTVSPGCNACDSGKTRTGLLDRLRNRFRQSDECCSGPTPAPTCNPCATPGYSQPNLLDRIKSRFGKKVCGCNTCGSSPVGGCCPGTIVPPPCCATPVPPGTTPTPGTPGELPKVMEKSKDTKGSDVKPANPTGADPKPVAPSPTVPKGNSGPGVSLIPRATAPVALPPLPVMAGTPR